ncbi:MAG TPA: hypothetical protein DEH75_19910 [Bradyrhizobium sp.]|nr:hypothetical protein [Bradyrhizobium sp.]HAR13726.1 hypothetical protein [Bradyrhizobium sp.]HAR24087.1 hypothetical protein [Bradyrhizobium sp.]HBY28773.1 hypothetical protein [Bradyrhizobium sp.]
MSNERFGKMARATDARADGEIAYRSAEAIANDTRAGRNAAPGRNAMRARDPNAHCPLPR